MQSLVCDCFAQQVFNIYPWRYVSIICLFSLSSYIPLYKCTRICIFLLLLMDIWVVSNLGPLWVSYYKDSCTSLFVGMFSFLLGWSSMARSKSRCMFNIRRNCQTLFQSSYNVFISTDRIWALWWFHFLDTAFDCSNSSRCEMTFPCGFHVHFPDDNDVEPFYHVMIGHLHFFIWEVSIQITFPNSLSHLFIIYL